MSPILAQAHIGFRSPDDLRRRDTAAAIARTLRPRRVASQPQSQSQRGDAMRSTPSRVGRCGACGWLLDARRLRGSEWRSRLSRQSATWMSLI